MTSGVEPPKPVEDVRFGRFCLRLTERQLLAEGKPVKLGARAFDLLEMLIDRHSRTVTRREIFERVWAGRVVEDHNLQVQVMALRKALGSSAIATIPGRGYRFALAIESGTQPEPPAQVAPPELVATREASGSDAPNNLPSDVPLLHGRTGAIAELASLVAQHRMVTIAGIGGVGKTRLAQAVARELSRTRALFSDGVWIVGLQALSDGQRVPGEVAHAIGLSVHAARASAEGLADSLSSLSLLIVLDNCEHVVSEAGHLASTLLRRAPHVRLLAASQEPLKIDGERVYRLGALDVPDKLSLDQARRCPAVSLFVERATAADPRFALSASNVTAIADICRQLDGVPLALELAAARVPLLGIDGVRARLNDRFRLLTAGARSAPARHQTLRGVLEWSHSLLSAAERQVFHRLGVCAGSFDIELAQAVAATALDGWDTLDHLGALVDKSLVLVGDAEPPRYRLLESCRLYALEALESDGDAAATRRRHAYAVLALFQRADASYLDTPVLDWLQQLAGDVDNWRNAFSWACAQPEEQVLAVSLATYGAPYLAFAGFGAEAVRACEAVRSWLIDELPLELRARFALTEAQMGGAHMQGPRDTLNAAQRAATLYRQLGDGYRLYVSLGFVEQFAERVGADEDIRPAIDEMRRLESPQWSVLRRRVLRQAEARQLRREGRWAENRDAFLAEVKLFEAAGDHRNAWYARHAAAMADIALGNIDAAVEGMRHVVAQIRARGMTSQFWPQVATLASALIEQGDADAALPAAREAIALLRVEGVLSWMTYHLPVLCIMMCGDDEAAARVLGWADAESERSGYGRRSPFFERSNQRLRERLSVTLADRLQHLRAEGAAMPADQIAQIVLAACAARESQQESRPKERV